MLSKDQPNFSVYLLIMSVYLLIIQILKLHQDELRSHCVCLLFPEPYMAFIASTLNIS